MVRTTIPFVLHVHLKTKVVEERSPIVDFILTTFTFKPETEETGLGLLSFQL